MIGLIFCLEFEVAHEDWLSTVIQVARGNWRDFKDT